MALLDDIIADSARHAKTSQTPAPVAVPTPEASPAVRQRPTVTPVQVPQVGRDVEPSPFTFYTDPKDPRTLYVAPNRENSSMRDASPAAFDRELVSNVRNVVPGVDPAVQVTPQSVSVSIESGSTGQMRKIAIDPNLAVAPADLARELTNSSQSFDYKVPEAFRNEVNRVQAGLKAGRLYDANLRLQEFQNDHFGLTPAQAAAVIVRDNVNQRTHSISPNSTDTSLEIDGPQGKGKISFTPDKLHPDSIIIKTEGTIDPQLLRGVPSRNAPITSAAVGEALQLRVVESAEAKQVAAETMTRITQKIANQQREEAQTGFRLSQSVKPAQPSQVSLEDVITATNSGHNAPPEPEGIRVDIHKLSQGLVRGERTPGLAIPTVDELIAHQTARAASTNLDSVLSATNEPNVMDGVIAATNRDTVVRDAQKAAMAGVEAQPHVAATSPANEARAAPVPRDTSTPIPIDDFLHEMTRRAAQMPSNASPIQVSSAATDLAVDVSHLAKVAPATEDLSKLAQVGQFLGKVGKVAGPVGKVLAVAGVIGAGVAASNKADAEVLNTTPQQTEAYKQAALVGSGLDAIIPIPMNLGADRVRDTLLQQGLPADQRARMQIGDPTSQIGRVRDRLPGRAEENMSQGMKELVALNANIRSLEGQEAADPSLRSRVDVMEKTLYSAFDKMRSDPQARAELTRVTGVPIDAAEQTYVLPSQDTPTPASPPVNAPALRPAGRRYCGNMKANAAVSAENRPSPVQPAATPVDERTAAVDTAPTVIASAATAAAARQKPTSYVSFKPF